MEECRSPLNPHCRSRDIALYIVYEGKRLPICRRCWEQIAETNLEWGEGVSRAKLKRQVEEAQRELLKKAEEEFLRKMAEKFIRSHREKSAGTRDRQRLRRN